MFSNILKWTFKIAIGEVEKELHLHLDNDTPLDAIEQVALQMIAHCAKVKEAVLAQKKANESVKEENKQIEPEPIVIEDNEHD